MRYALHLIGFCFIVVALIISISHYGREIIETHNLCHLCVKDNVEYKCDCETVTKYEDKIPIEWWVVWGIGAAFEIMGWIKKE